VPENERSLTEYFRRKRGRLAAPLPYDAPVETPDPSYAFGRKYLAPDEPFDDVIERKSELVAVNARLTPQALLVVNSVVLTDQTDELARTYESLGAILCCSDASKSTMIRRGKEAIQETANELNVIYQTLAAA
jgi:hypothetical protein